MNSGMPKTKLNAQIYEEACEWLVHFRAGDADDDLDARQRLDEWLRRSPEHVRAYLEVSAIFEDAASHDAERKVDAEAHIARALAERNIIPLDSALDVIPAKLAPGAVRGPGTQPKGRSLRLPFTLAASALLALGAASAWWFSARNVYTTAIGEQRSLTLDDGSTVALNARSKVNVRFSDGERLVDLLEGQALFKVAKEASRPFVVASHDIRVRAIGTQFDVNRRKAATTVTVIEGRVGVVSNAVRQASGTAVVSDTVPASQAPVSSKLHEVVLDAGERLVLAPEKRAAPEAANIAAATAWTQQRLVFDSAPLSEVAEEFNRYNKRPIVIQDKALESFGVIGVFSSSDPSSFITFLRAQPEMVVSESDSKISIARK